MRFTAHIRFLLASLLLVVAGPLGTEADAASTLVNYAYAGSITSVSPLATQKTGVVAGDTITGTFSYDSLQGGNPTTGQFNFTGSSLTHTFTLTVFNNQGKQVFRDSYSGNSTAYYFTQVSFMNSSLTTVNFEGDTIYKQGLGITEMNGFTAFNLALSDTSGQGGFTPTNQPLPTPTTIKDFVSNTGTLTWDPPDQVFVASITQFVDLTPEPSSWVMAAVAILVGSAVTVRSRRSQNRRPRP
jgi:hypothetical protein